MPNCASRQYRRSLLNHEITSSLPVRVQTLSFFSRRHRIRRREQYQTAFCLMAAQSTPEDRRLQRWSQMGQLVATWWYSQLDATTLDQRRLFVEALPLQLQHCRLGQIACQVLKISAFWQIFVPMLHNSPRFFFLQKTARLQR